MLGPGLGATLALLAWAAAGLPSFGTVHSAYAAFARHAAYAGRHTASSVAAVVFDVRAFDTMVEEFILFAAATATALLLRSTREQEAERAEDDSEGDALMLFGIAAAGALVVVGLYVVAHGPVSPGGGFQGGVVLATAAALVFLGGTYRAFRRVTPESLVEAAEAVGVFAWPALGVGVLAAGSGFLANVLPLGSLGSLASSGTIALLNAATGLAVAAAFTLIAIEFLEELLAERGPAAGRGGAT